MQATSIERYLVDDTIFNKLNNIIISLDPDDKKNNNQQLKPIFDSLIEAMKQQSPLFKKTYQRCVFAGSYYKNTRVGKPEEYDVNFVIKLPFKEKDIKFISDGPGYIKLRTTWKDMSYNTLNLEQKALSELNSFIDEESYLNQDTFRTWMEGILSKVAYKSSKSNRIILNGSIQITIKKAGPAFTLRISGLNIDIDVVPVLAFSNSNPPPKCSKRYILERYNSGSRYWSAVPKPLNNSKTNFPDKRYRYWRLCFYEFEKDILGQHQYGPVKPIIRHLKKLRDTQKWNIASYYIETLCLNNLDIFHISNKYSFTRLCFTMLQILREAFRNNSIEYFWDEDLNLLEHIGFFQMKNMEGNINRIIKTIENTIANDKYAMAKKVLDEDEFDEFYKSCESVSQRNYLNVNQPYYNEPEPEPTSNWSCVII